MESFLEELICYNKNTIKELSDLLVFFKNNTSDFLHTHTSCFDELVKLSHAFCGFPFGNYSEVYYHTLERPPIGKEFDVQWCSMREQTEGWIQLTKEQKDSFEKKLPAVKKVPEITDETIEKLKPLIKNAIDENIVIKCLDVLNVEYSELEKMDEKWIYSREDVISKFTITQVVTSDYRSAQAGHVHPYHSRVMAYYHSIYSTIALITKKIEGTIRILTRINKTLPIAKLKEGQNEMTNISTYNIATYVQGNNNTLSENSSYVNSGEMNLNIQNFSQIEESIKELLKNLDETTDLTVYQKKDVAKDVTKLVSELGKPVDEQNKGFIEHTLNKIWTVTKDVVSLSGFLVSIATALGFTL